MWATLRARPNAPGKELLSRTTKVPGAFSFNITMASSLVILGLYQYLDVSFTNFGVMWTASESSEVRLPLLDIPKYTLGELCPVAECAPGLTALPDMLWAMCNCCLSVFRLLPGDGGLVGDEGLLNCCEANIRGSVFTCSPSWVVLLYWVWCCCD